MTSTRETTTLQATVEIELCAGDARPEADAAQLRQAFAPHLVEYLSAADGSFLSDYGPEAWGGYDGPTVLSSQVRINENPQNAAADADTAPAASLSAAAVVLNWRCENDEYTAEQPLTEIVEAGTAICAVCGDDMELAESVSVTS